MGMIGRHNEPKKSLISPDESTAALNNAEARRLAK